MGRTSAPTSGVSSEEYEIFGIPKNGIPRNVKGQNVVMKRDIQLWLMRQHCACVIALSQHICRPLENAPIYLSMLLQNA